MASLAEIRFMAYLAIRPIPADFQCVPTFFPELGMRVRFLFLMTGYADGFRMTTRAPGIFIARPFSMYFFPFAGMPNRRMLFIQAGMTDGTFQGSFPFLMANHTILHLRDLIAGNFFTLTNIRMAFLAGKLIFLNMDFMRKNNFSIYFRHHWFNFLVWMSMAEQTFF